ncbi:acidic leucine-rich nuclear phosphoprotein 32 family member A isoform X2 [Teleopsis dalmanni]|uniref:acidic leucine-rich nuclear phosphoprotein 32 family member A isoform X2 n=1 Tax=Teleopsis dalmanni TaxID=139649 RepID=UPI0018CE8891|nr:acidic leucine-rich nuclear phosphoprotein 32 family member A isoform X2 [Teleopsis dalmanni]
MEKRIHLEKRGKKANQITELNLDNCRATSIVGFTEEFTALETLSLINVGLTTLKGFPVLPNLKKLELSDNRISTGLNYLASSPKLQSLNLSGNKIKELEALKPLQEFKNLAVLDLFNNEATLVENYREKIFEMLPSLKYLDGFDCNDVEVQSEDDDDEVNGNSDDESDKQNVFCLNGLEFDLDELEEFEKRVKAKKESNCASRNIDEVDDLDEYLKELNLKEANNSNSKANEEDECKQSSSLVETTSTNRFSLSYVLTLYWFYAILNLATIVFRINNNSCSDEDAYEEDDSDVSLSEVYNEDLEEDNSEWDEDGVEEEDDDDIEDDEAFADGELDKSASKPAVVEEKASANDTEESQARGKKRKHDG